MLRYGIESEIDLRLPASVRLTVFDSPKGEPLADVSAAVRTAISEPIEFPALAQAVVPGDKVALALGENIPQPFEVLAPIIECLAAHGVAADDITVVAAPGISEDRIEELRSRLEQSPVGSILLERHDPTNRLGMSYLAATEAGRAIYLNRRLYDADLVVPIACMLVDESPGYRGMYDGLYPTFSNEEVVEMHRRSAVSSAREWEATRAETNQVGWLLGAQFTVQIVPGAGDAILHVIAGEASAVFAEGQRLFREAWSFSAPERAELVVAAVSGRADQQNWNNLARAVAAALRVVADDGVIALCTEINEKPGPALRRLAASKDLEDAARRLRGQRSGDALAATELAEALKRAKVYLLSQLDEEFVEGLGVAPVAEPAEIVRLAGRHPSCIVLGNAQCVVATPVD